MHSISQRAIAETFGTAALVLVGPGSVIATLTLAGKAVPAVTEADLLAISFAFGFIITALVYAIGKVSGCHINPAVTFALAVTKRFPWKEVPVYWGAQYVGAIIGAFAIWGVFGANAVTFGMGQTHFAADASTTVYMQAALAEALGTGLLLFAILGIVDSRSAGGPLAGVVIGGAVVHLLDAIHPRLPDPRPGRCSRGDLPVRLPGQPAPGRAPHPGSRHPRRHRRARRRAVALTG